MWRSYALGKFSAFTYGLEIRHKTNVRVGDNKVQIINKGGVDVLITLLRETRDVIVKRAIVTALSNIVDCKYLNCIPDLIIYSADNAVEVIDNDALDLLLVLMEKTDDERLLSGVVHTISNIANAGMIILNHHAFYSRIILS